MFLEVEYAKTQLAIGEETMVTMTMTTEQDEAMPIVELGVPPGFALQADDLELAKAEGRLTRYEMKNGRVVLYFNQLLEGEPFEHDVHAQGDDAWWTGPCLRRSCIRTTTRRCGYESESFGISVVD